MRTTTMNFQGNAVLRKLLPGLELSHGGLSSEHKLPNADHLSELQRIVTSHKVCKIFIGRLLNTLFLRLLNTQLIISKTFSRFVAFLFILLSPTWIHQSRLQLQQEFILIASQEQNSHWLYMSSLILVLLCRFGCMLRLWSGDVETRNYQTCILNNKHVRTIFVPNFIHATVSYPS